MCFIDFVCICSVYPVDPEDRKEDSQDYQRPTNTRDVSDLDAPGFLPPSHQDPDLEDRAKVPGYTVTGRTPAEDIDPLKISAKDYENLPDLQENTPLWKQVLGGIGSLIVVGFGCWLISCCASRPK